MKTLIICSIINTDLALIALLIIVGYIGYCYGNKSKPSFINAKSIKISEILDKVGIIYTPEQLKKINHELNIKEEIGFK